MTKPFNPLDKVNLGLSVANALLALSPSSLGDNSGIVGAGVYAIYYTGPYPAYAQIAAKNRNGRFGLPIYVGKAVPKGGRKGLSELDALNSNSLRARLDEHADSIRQASESLNIDDFWCRHLVVDDIWIPLGESVLIREYQPLWNQVVDGFGNHDPGSGRHKGRRSMWDELHPGRQWVKNLEGACKFTAKEIAEHIQRALAAKP